MSKNEKPMLLDFSSLALIPQLLERITDLQNEIKIIKNTVVPKYDLTKREDVKSYLNICETTLNNMMNDGRLKHGIHFKKDIKGSRTKITFIESAILDFKEKYK